MSEHDLRAIGDAVMQTYYDECYRKALERVRRLKRLRQIAAPRWVIRHEQVMLYVNMKGSLTRADSEHYDRLYFKFIEPAFTAHMKALDASIRAEEQTAHH